MNIQEYIQNQNRWNIKHRILSSNDILAEDTGHGYKFHLTDKQPTSSASASSYSYSGPFAVVQNGDTAVTVYGYNDESDRYFRDYIILGTAIEELAEQDVESITTDGYVYLNISYSAGWVIVPEFAAAIPAQDSTHIYHPLAFIKCTDSVITSILQVQYGIVHFPARVL